MLISLTVVTISQMDMYIKMASYTLYNMDNFVQYTLAPVCQSNLNKPAAGGSTPLVQMSSLYSESIINWILKLVEI